jgi:D-3-phosphoglycerate dehydrogenase / 2-oxoglutarate reductase
VVFRILNAEPLDFSPEARTLLQEVARVEERNLSRSELVDCLAQYEGLIVRLGFQVDREVIDAGKRLKVISSATTGMDHIDVEYAASRGIAVLSLRGEAEFLRSIPATAELTWGLLLALTRHIPAAQASVLVGEWDREAYRGHDLGGKCLGILGLGRIGEKVARYGLAFGMHVRAWDPFRAGWMENVEKASSLDNLVTQADVLSIHVPLNKETYQLVRARELTMLPAAAVLINTARGDVLDSQALLMALENGRLAGAGLDVLPGERDPADDEHRKIVEYARQHDNLLITPHIGGATDESMASTEIFMAKKLAAWLKKQDR